MKYRLTFLLFVLNASFSQATPTHHKYNLKTLVPSSRPKGPSPMTMEEGTLELTLRQSLRSPTTTQTEHDLATKYRSLTADPVQKHVYRGQTIQVPNSPFSAIDRSQRESFTKRSLDSLSSRSRY